VLKEKGASTLGGQKIWYDESVNRLNTDGKGTLLGEFRNGDRLIEITKSGFYRITSSDLTTHFEDDVLMVEKFRSNKVFSVVYYDVALKSYYLKRFVFEATQNLTNFTTEEDGSKLICISSRQHPRFAIKFGGAHKTRPVEIISAEEFIAVKGFKARGKRLTTYVVSTITEAEPLIPDEEIDITPEIINDTIDLDNDDENNPDSSQMTLEI
jgi:topoisomerase-4 subunit A